jgi:hypothetical protein
LPHCANSLDRVGRVDCAVHEKGMSLIRSMDCIAHYVLQRNVFMIQSINELVILLPNRIENADVILLPMEQPIPFDAAGTSVFLISMAANAFSLWILLWILWGKIQIHYAARLLILFVNCIGILWNIISVIRYYYRSPPHSELIHYLFGLFALLGDFMVQFEILKLFQVISGLDQKKLQKLQWFSLIFCGTLGMGPFFRLLDPLNFILRRWENLGVIMATLFISLFYFWYQIFLVTKLYQSMQQCAKLAKRKSQNSIAYIQLICKLVFLSLYQYVGLCIWGWGFWGTQNSSQNLTRDRMLVRIGESIGQSHLVLNVLFIKAIKEFRFPTPTKTPSPPPKKVEEDTIKL